jgi:hypothetical protein
MPGAQLEVERAVRRPVIIRAAGARGAGPLDGLSHRDSLGPAPRVTAKSNPHSHSSPLTHSSRLLADETGSDSQRDIEDQCADADHHQ